MTRYLMRERPTGAPFQVLLDHQRGDEFDADLDAATADLLVGSGVLEIVESRPPEPTSGSAPPEPVHARKQRAAVVADDDERPERRSQQHPRSGERGEVA